MALDPNLKEMLLAQRRLEREGKKYKRPPVIPEIAKAYQQDPRTQLAVKALAAGSDTGPVAQGKYAWADGIARALTGVAGGYINKQQAQQYGKDEDELRDTRYIRGLEGLSEDGKSLAPAAAAQATLANTPAPVDAVPPPTPLQQASPQAMAAEAAGTPAMASQMAGALGVPAPPQPPPMAPPGSPMAPPSAPIPLAVGGGPRGGSPFPLDRLAGGSGDDVLQGGDLSLAGGRDALKAQGARITSGYRTPKHNAEVGGTANSFHTRGTPDNPQAYDFVPKAGESMALLQIKARKAFPGFDVINEGDHVHVEPSTRTAALQGTASDDVLQGGGSDNLEDYSFGQEPIPEAPVVRARPARPEAVKAGKSPLLRAAYQLMVDDNAYESAQGQEYYGEGLAEQGKLEEAAREREQKLIGDEYDTDRSMFATSVNNADLSGYRVREGAIEGNRSAKAEAFKAANTAREGALDRAARLEEQRIQSAAAVEAAKAKAKEAGMPQPVASKIVDLGSRLDSLQFLDSDKKDDYFGKWANNFDVATNRFIGNNPEMANWWETYQTMVNDVRKGTFGATLTPNEKAEFEKSVVLPKTAPNVAKQNIAKQHRILQIAAGRTGRAISSKYGADNVTEAFGRDVTTLGVGVDPYRAAPNAPAAPASKPPAGVDAKAWQYMTPEERALFK